jgi:gliding motility-associated lipoprotein GldH
MKISAYIAFFCALSLLAACEQNTLVDQNMDVPQNEWTYNNPLKLTYHITDTTKAYQLNCKLRLSNDYRYANIFVIANFSHKNKTKATRYQFQLAKADGQWLGKGSGNLYTYLLPLHKNYKFTDTGTYELSIEQNMRDNPLIGISDVGAEVVKITP